MDLYEKCVEALNLSWRSSGQTGSCRRRSALPELSRTPPVCRGLEPICFGAYAPDIGKRLPCCERNMVAIFQGVNNFKYALKMTGHIMPIFPFSYEDHTLSTPRYYCATLAEIQALRRRGAGASRVLCFAFESELRPSPPRRPRRRRRHSASWRRV